MRVDGDDIGMANALERRHFLPEPALHPVPVGQLAAKDLDGTAPLLLPVIARHHIGEAAAPDQIAHFETLVQHGPAHGFHLRQQRLRPPDPQIRQQFRFLPQPPTM